MSGKAEVIHGTGGGATGGALGGDITGPLGAVTVGCVDWPGLGGLVGGWTSLTKYNPDESDLPSDSRNWQSLDGARSCCASFIFFAGNQVSSNFTSQEISKCWWTASQNTYPLDLSS